MLKIENVSEMDFENCPPLIHRLFTVLEDFLDEDLR